MKYEGCNHEVVKGDDVCHICHPLGVIYADPLLEMEDMYAEDCEDDDEDEDEF